MDRAQRRTLRAAIPRLSDLVSLARDVISSREEALARAGQARATCTDRASSFSFPDDLTLGMAQFSPGDMAVLHHLVQGATLPSLPAPDAAVIEQILHTVAPHLDDAQHASGVRRVFMASERLTEVEHRATYLIDFDRWAVDESVTARLASLAYRSNLPVESEAALGRLLRSHPLHELLPTLGDSSVVIGPPMPDRLRRADAALRDLAQLEVKARAAARRAGDGVRKAETDQFVAAVSVDRLRDVTNARIRVTSLQSAGLKTVADVLERSWSLQAIQGIGQKSAAHIEGAARTIWQTTFDEMPVRIDISNRTRETTTLLTSVHSWLRIRAARGSQRIAELHLAMSRWIAQLRPDTTHVVVLNQADRANEFLAQVEEYLAAAELAGQAGSVADPWEDFLARPADYFAALNELGILTEDESKAEGDLPQDIINAVRALTLDGTHFTGSLRGYQSFGAKFALVQKKVIIGDEMGLGKTIEALAVFTHLRAKGSQHFLVICPAAVVTNWMREVGSKTQLPGHRLHGSVRDTALRQWARRGGVAVTTFDTMRWLSTRPDFQSVEVEAVAVDEAHYIKNPAAQRSQRAAELINTTRHVVLLTGTPMENRLDEFQRLVSYLRPDLTVDAHDFAPARFRRQVAPAYLRRNQEDVLTELPALVEVDEWLPMSKADSRSYLDAVRDGSFMAMRQAAMRADGSEKVTRLVELVAEAEENGRRVLVFSYFRDVLEHIARVLPGPVFGPLTGSVPAAKRQQMVDEFSRSRGGAVLVSQIEAGGIGLNIQAASMVVICEPQLKPTTEWQAIARARRMGQLETVQVHRLLSEEGVDRRVTEILAHKAGLFEEFARVSETAAIAPEALDVSEGDLASQIVAEERVRLLSMPTQHTESGDLAHG